MKLGQENQKVNYSAFHNWRVRLIPKIKCFFKGHSYNYSLGWGKGNYDDIWFVCDRCDRHFFMFRHSEVKPWNESLKALELERDTLRKRQDPGTS